MFNFVNQQQENECFICYSDGKTEEELIFEKKSFIRTLNYPLIPLSDAYGCKCKLMSHNRCLVTCKKCPSCRRQVTPNLYVKTHLDYWFYYLFKWIKENHEYFESIRLGMIVLFVIFIYVVYNLCYKKKIVKFPYIYNHDKEKQIMILFCILYNIAMISLAILDDYMKKYWLYKIKKNPYSLIKKFIDVINEL